MRRLLNIAVVVLVVIIALAAGLLGGALYHTRILAMIGANQEGAVSINKMIPEPNAVVSPATQAQTSGTAGRKERKILYWQDAMYNPPYISDKPGKSPMGMDLKPVYDDQVSSGSTVTIDPAVIQNMGVRTAGVEHGPLFATVCAVGTFMEPEQNHIEISLRVNGWIQKLYANQNGMSVKKGDPLFDLYSPELTAAADELISARSASSPLGDDPTAKSSTAAILAAARRKLELLGIADEEIDAIAKMETAPKVIAFQSPITGHIAEKHVIEGSAVKAGDDLMRVADRSSMWLQVQIFEHDLSLVQLGSPVTATITALPGETLEGKVDFVYPHLDPTTRTATVRVVFPNHDHRIHENMYAEAVIRSEIAADALSVPREAIIDSGTRQIVFLSDGGGHFFPREVTVGMTGRNSRSANEYVQIISGLAGAETVVTSGQFLLDSESRLQEAIQKQLKIGTPAIESQKAPDAAQKGKSNPQIDRVLSAYLALTTQLTGPNAVVADPKLLVEAAYAFTQLQPAGNLRDEGAIIQTAAEKLAGRDLATQREGLKAISSAIVQLLDDAAPSTAVASALYQFNCPMTHADWVQATEKPVNPYLPDMPTCATLTRTIAARPARPAREERP